MLQGVSVRVRPFGDDPLVGEILVRTPQMFSGYFGKSASLGFVDLPDENPTRYFITGDLVIKVI